MSVRRVPAAILVPIVLGARPGVLLTKRNERLRRHAGQVSFPGGRIDPGDADATAAALREAEEEIALAPSRVEVVGRLDDYLTGTGFRITPVLGLLLPGLIYDPAPHEVEAVFELPIEILLDPSVPQCQRMERNGVVRDVWVWPHAPPGREHGWPARRRGIHGCLARGCCPPGFHHQCHVLTREGGVFDYFGGVADLRAGRVRFVGDPATRIAEDYLRVLRFVRFVARYGRGEPDAPTLAAIRGAAPGLALR